MAKKAKKVSWRTLARQADKVRSPRKASALRKEAWRVRRADRATKGTKKTAPAGRGAKAWATRRANEIKKAAESGGLASVVTNRQGVTMQGIDREATELWQATTSAIARGAPGHGEVVGGAYAELAERIAKLARKKGGMNGVYNELAALAQAKHYEGCVETDKTATQRLIEVQQILADRVVCGFIAEVDALTAQHRGLPPAMTLNLSAFLVVKIVDALNKAGYRASGKT